MLEILTKLLFLYLPFQIALNPAEGFDLASVRIIIPLLFIAWLIDGLKNKKIIIPNNLTFFLLISFLFLTSFSLFFAENFVWGLRKLIFLFSIFPLFFVVHAIFSSNQAKKLSLLKFTALGGVFTALLGIIQFLLQLIIPLNKLYSAWAIIIVPFLGNSFSQAVLTNPSWLVNVGGHTLLRATAFFPDPHMLAFYLNITGLISLGIYFSQQEYDLRTSPLPLLEGEMPTGRGGGKLTIYFSKHLSPKEIKNKKNYYLFFSIIIFLASFLTFSRGGYLGLIAGLLFFGFFTFKSKLKYFFNNAKRVISLIFILITFSLILAIPNPITNRLTSSFDLSEGSNTGRIETWKQSLEIIKANPTLGVGLGNYSLSIKPSANYREPIYSHNTFLDIAAETGILNALVWLLLFLFSIINFTRGFIINNDFIDLALVSALVSLSIHSLFETAIFSVHILPLIILILSLNNSKQN
ncbi:MAG: O-antigen polymerase [Candidatus Moranbacteria bacterium GW2011_GWE1_35_17]|nr:MAG: O-antigen polymerase [Candidatus Moranbacteria bacterium GW2011_GWE1_35_17]KKP83393.1 MAG: O-antigen polymerase [Candidatus Moranbacteria bacterium GW2011_GWF1_35_5]KKP85234.1 MAG: O-antigen polymerase [Candidatus Moranbacteria bacterium GW2011_GWF2_35_54]